MGVRVGSPKMAKVPQLRHRMAHYTRMADLPCRSLILRGKQKKHRYVRYIYSDHTGKAGLILGLAVLGSPEFVIQPWHQTLLTIGIVAFCAFFNIFLAPRLPLMEAIVLVLHVAGVFVIIIPLWVTAPRGNAHDTILNFTNGGGWQSDGLSYAIGIVPMIGMLIVS